MKSMVSTSLGIFFLSTWVILCETSCIPRDATLINGSFAIGASFVIVMLLHALLNRTATVLRPVACAGLAALILALGLMAAAAPNNIARLLGFCCQAGCAAVVAALWGYHLARFTKSQATALSLLACAAACIVVALANGAQLAVGALAALCPCASALALAWANQAADSTSTPDPNSETPPHAGFSDPGTPDADTRWRTPVLLCICGLLASFYCGMVNVPYIANSPTVLNIACWAGVVLLTIMALIALGLKRWGKNDNDTADRLDLHLSMALAVMVLILGLLLFGLRAPGTMSKALGLMMCSSFGLMALGWIMLPRFAQGIGFPYVTSFSLVLLAEGLLFAQCFGIWFTQTAGLGYMQLSNAGIAVLAVIAVVFVGYMAWRVYATARTPQPIPAEQASLDSFSLDEIKQALREQQLKMLEPYGLTKRELEIVGMIIDGNTFGSIAEQLFISENTVKFHSKNAYDKLNVHSKKELMLKISEMQ